MTTRLLALLLLAATTLAAAEPRAPLLLLPAPDAANWEALLCATLVALYVARRRSHWRSG
jgi:hypothetical protein